MISQHSSKIVAARLAKQHEGDDVKKDVATGHQREVHDTCGSLREEEVL